LGAHGTKTSRYSASGGGGWRAHAPGCMQTVHTGYSNSYSMSHSLYNIPSALKPSGRFDPCARRIGHLLACEEETHPTTSPQRTQKGHFSSPKDPSVRSTASEPPLRGEQGADGARVSSAVLLHESSTLSRVKGHTSYPFARSAANLLLEMLGIHKY